MLSWESQLIYSHLEIRFLRTLHEGFYHLLIFDSLSIKLASIPSDFYQGHISSWVWIRPQLILDSTFSAFPHHIPHSKKSFISLSLGSRNSVFRKLKWYTTFSLESRSGSSNKLLKMRLRYNYHVDIIMIFIIVSSIIIWKDHCKINRRIKRELHQAIVKRTLESF